ncbi:hypothetical protein [Streptomyces sp. NPDC001480]|uniref:hypothetical protein n=1 Tax=Streptomyces sp. NPDC001480 TaxID=3364577 RepID=UPI00369FAA7A
MRDLDGDEEPAAGTGVTRSPETGSGACTAGADGGSGDTTGASGPATVPARADAGGTEGVCPPVRMAPPDGANANAELDAAVPLGGVSPLDGVEEGAELDVAVPPGAAAPVGVGADVAVGLPGATGPLGATARAGEAGPAAAVAVPAVPRPSPTPPGTRGGSSRSGTAGVRCTTGCPGGPANGRAAAGFSRPDTGRAADERNVSPSIALDRPSSTAWEAAPMNDGFCHVGSRPPNPASATPAGLGAMARWIGGSPGQEAATTGRPPIRTSPLAGSGPTASPAAPSAGTRFRNRSRKPTAQPSAPARVTRDAIWSV